MIAHITADPILRRGLLYLIFLLAISGSGIIVTSLFLWLKGNKKELGSLWAKYLAWFIIIPILIVPLIYGKSYFITAILLLSLFCFREFSLAVGLWKDKGFTLFGYFSIFLIFIPVYIDWYGLFTAMPIYCMLGTLAIPILRGEFEGMIQKTCLTILGILYFGWFFAHVAYLTNMNFGFGHIFFLFLLVELNDVSAFIIGKLLGKHKLAPRISPNKTIEGMLGSLALTVGFALVFRFAVPEYAAWQVALIGALISFGGMFGDLCISFIKRDLQIKDMGRLIPGHGGLLDRFDSVIFAAPIFFHFTRYFFWTMFFKP